MIVCVWMDTLKILSVFIVLKCVMKIVFSVGIVVNVRFVNLAIIVMMLENVKNVMLNVYLVVHMMYALYVMINRVIEL